LSRGEQKISPRFLNSKEKTSPLFIATQVVEKKEGRKIFFFDVMFKKKKIALKVLVEEHHHEERGRVGQRAREGLKKKGAYGTEENNSTRFVFSVEVHRKPTHK
jgi:hypothetical protein